MDIEIKRLEGQGGKVEKGDVVVAWADLMDAEYAEKWDERIVHTELGERDHYSAPKVMVPEVAKEEVAEATA